MIVHPQRDFGIRPRKIIDNYRKENYWTTQKSPDHSPSYVWDPNPHLRSRSEERPPRCFDALPCDDTIVRKDLKEYLLTSTLHGLRYIGEGKLTWFERFFWLGAFGCSLITASFFIMNIYDKWRSAPMIVSVNPQNWLLQDLPFPAITICNVNQAKKSVAKRYKETGSSLDKKLLQSLCTSDNDTAIFDNNTSNANWDYQRSFLINVTQPCTEMLDQCYWNTVRQECQDLFNAQLTDEGLCCTFNVVHREMMFRNPRDLYDLNLTFPSVAVDWTPENGYPPDAPDTGFPWRPLGVGTHHGLTLVLDTNLDEYYCGSTSSPGFKILMHNPTETPKIAALGDIYGPGIEARVAILPRILDAQPQIMSIDPDKRLCVFSSERNLTFYRTYTQKNCEMECEAESMIAKCNCVQYFMPKNRSTLVCGKADADCYLSETTSALDSSRVFTSLFDGGGAFCTALLVAIATYTDENKMKNCNCPPACTEISYSERSSTAPLSNTLIKQNKYLLNMTSEYFKENMLVIHFYFEDNSFIRYTKGVIFGLTEFLSNTGGLLGLCMGFSMMSLVELIYFMTLKALCATMRRKPAHQRFVK